MMRDEMQMIEEVERREDIENRVGERDRAPMGW
jgi:hypothetical protein